MELALTIRGLDRMQAGSARGALQKSLGRLERLLGGETAIRAVIDGTDPEYRVSLCMGVRGQDLVAEDSGYDLGAAIAAACERLRAQIVRVKTRREGQRHRPLWRLSA